MEGLGMCAAISRSASSCHDGVFRVPDELVKCRPWLRWLAQETGWELSAHEQRWHISNILGEQLNNWLWDELECWKKAFFEYNKLTLTKLDI